MFNNVDNTVLIHKLNSSMMRSQITTGHVFLYDSSSEGYVYAHIGQAQGMVFSLKLPRDAQTIGGDMAPVSFASTPTASSRLSAMVTVIGYYTLHAQLHNEPSLSPLLDITPNSGQSNRVVSLRNDYDADGSPHLYFVLGKVPSTSSEVRSCVLARLTKCKERTDNMLHVLPDSTMVADRGYVTVNMYEGRE